MNACLRRLGFSNLHQKEERDLAAYYMCGCREKGCFLVTFTRPPAPKKKEKGRKVAREWSIKSIGSHVCDPHEPRSVAIANTWIPISVKALLVSLYDQSVSVDDAHRQAIEFAFKKNLPTVGKVRREELIRHDSETVPQRRYYIATRGAL
jgi:hypothetical protein